MEDELDKFDEDERKEVEVLNAELALEKEKLEAELAKGKHEIVKSLSSDESDQILAEYENQCAQMKEKQFRDEMNRRKILELKLIARQSLCKNRRAREK